MKIPTIMSARFVSDEASRILVLSDALRSGDGAAISAALLDVARARGIAQLARQAGLPVERIYEALRNPCQPDLLVIGQILEAMQGRTDA